MYQSSLHTYRCQGLRHTIKAAVSTRSWPSDNGKLYFDPVGLRVCVWVTLGWNQQKFLNFILPPFLVPDTIVGSAWFAFSSPLVSGFGVGCLAGQHGEDQELGHQPTRRSSADGQADAGL